jgi:hypothetical protein
LTLIAGSPRINLLPMRTTLALLIVGLICLSCTVRKPLIHEPVTADYRHHERPQVAEALKQILQARKIPVARVDLSRGQIVTDSFEAAAVYCDCGMNFFGAQYPGTRRGQLRIQMSGTGETNLKFEFGALLTITANNKQVKCTSFGKLEAEIVAELDKALGTVRTNAQD